MIFKLIYWTKDKFRSEQTYKTKRGIENRIKLLKSKGFEYQVMKLNLKPFPHWLSITHLF